MKKYLFLVISILGLLGIISVHADDLKNISLDYCDTTGNILQYTLDPSTETGICYILSNNSDQEVAMKINFIDGTFTNDQRQNRACLDENAKQDFGQYVSAYNELITLTGGESTTQTAKLLYPQGSDGQYHGCITYSVVDKTNATTGKSSNFTILMRKAKFIDVLVGHPEKILGGVALKEFHAAGGNTISPNAKIRIYQDPADNKYVIELTIQNVGGIEEDAVITGIVSNFLNYKSTFVENRKLLKGQEFIITKKLEETPNYYFNVDIQIAYTPVISGIPTIAPQTSYLQETTRIFIVNAITIITGIGLLLLLLIIILLVRSSMRKKDKITGTPTNVPSASIGQIPTTVPNQTPPSNQ